MTHNQSPGVQRLQAPEERHPQPQLHPIIIIIIIIIIINNIIILTFTPPVQRSLSELSRACTSVSEVTWTKESSDDV